MRNIMCQPQVPTTFHQVLCVLVEAHGPSTKFLITKATALSEAIRLSSHRHQMRLGGFQKEVSGPGGPEEALKTSSFGEIDNGVMLSNCVCGQAKGGGGFLGPFKALQEPCEVA